MAKYELSLNENEIEATWAKDKCDKYDYMIAASCGMIAGVIDALFVKTPGQGGLGNITDAEADKMVQKVANMLWKGDGRSSLDGKPRHAPDTLEKSISYLEQAFPVNYDARYGADLVNPPAALSSMSPRNHHLLSLAHSPDIVGLIFSVLDQFTGQASFVVSGKKIRVTPIRDVRNNKVMYMQGFDIQSRLFCGFCNWLGHLMSDLCGSSSTRRAGKTGRGAGLPLPFYSLFLMMDFGDYDGKAFADIAVEVFEAGYDLRHGAAMAIPVVLEELSIRIIWALKRHFYAKKPWKECIPSSKHADLRMMLIVGNASLCLVDGIDAAIHSGMSGANPVVFLLHMNFVAWGRLLVLVFKELRYRYGSVVDQAFAQFFAKVGLNDRKVLEDYNTRMRSLQDGLDKKLEEFIELTEKEFASFMKGVDRSLNPNYGTPEQRRIASVEFARQQGVREERIFRSPEELRYWLQGR